MGAPFPKIDLHHPIAASTTLFVPWAYFIRTRLTGAKDVVFHSWYEWLPAVILVSLFSGTEADQGLLKLAINAFGFMALYEIGYITNDIYSTRTEKTPRARLTSPPPSPLLIAAAIVVRAIAFAAATLALGKTTDLSWFIFYASMCATFTLHNTISDTEFRAATFFGLASFRFFGTLVGVLGKDVLTRIIPAVLAFYVFFRSLGYLDSKGLLNLSKRRSYKFRISYYALLLPFSMGVWCLTGEWWTLLANAYFVAFWVALLFAEAIRPRSATSIA